MYSVFRLDTILSPNLLLTQVCCFLFKVFKMPEMDSTPSHNFFIKIRRFTLELTKCRTLKSRIWLKWSWECWSAEVQCRQWNKKQYLSEYLTLFLKEISLSNLQGFKGRSYFSISFLLLYVFDCHSFIEARHPKLDFNRNYLPLHFYLLDMCQNFLKQFYGFLLIFSLSAIKYHETNRSTNF